MKVAGVEFLVSWESPDGRKGQKICQTSQEVEKFVGRLAAHAKVSYREVGAWLKVEA